MLWSVVEEMIVNALYIKGFGERVEEKVLLHALYLFDSFLISAPL